MCFQGRSKFCLFCILLYSFIPHGILKTKADVTEATTYYPIKDVVEPYEHKEDDHTYQLKETVSHILDKDYYLDKVMEKYGNGTTMTFEGFEHLLHKLGLGKIIIFDHSIQCHKSNNSSNFHTLHETHNHTHIGPGSEHSSVICKEDPSVEHGESSEEHIEQHDNHEHNDNDHVHEHSDNDESPKEEGNHVHEHSEIENTTKHSHTKRATEDPEKCGSAKIFLHISKNPDAEFVTRSMFMEVCPSLIYQISEDVCHDYHPDHPGYQANHEESDHLHDHDDMEHSHGDESVAVGEGLKHVPAKVWGYSTIAVVIISLVGLLGVAVIPIMQKVFYNHLLQFLVALAVGALSGDALLHLLPHAIGGGHDSGHGHANSEADDEGHDHAVYKGLCGLIGIYFFYLVERVLTIVTDMKRRKKHSRNRQVKGNDEMDKIGEKLAADCDEMMMSVHPNKALRGYADEAHSEHCMISFENTTAISHQHGKHKQADPEERVDMLSHANGHGHGHSHCVDGAPNSIAAIAWMVILGDGIHNFSDGLAIGAAFSNSITGGFSTSIAVFCHELPHEIGDFAMLLRAGMAPKQAIIYNCLSSVLCFIGMLIGVAIGNIENASLWIFAIVGGMFLYIALVDMLPEMSSVDPKRGENPFCHLALQLLGMLLGGSIMLVIAVYEDSLKNLLE